MDLRFYYPFITAKLARPIGRLLRAISLRAWGNLHAKFCQHILSLIFMDLHLKGPFGQNLLRSHQKAFTVFAIKRLGRCNSGSGDNRDADILHGHFSPSNGAD